MKVSFAVSISLKWNNQSAQEGTWGRRQEGSSVHNYSDAAGCSTSRKSRLQSQFCSHESQSTQHELGSAADTGREKTARTGRAYNEKQAPRMEPAPSKATLGPQGLLGFRAGGYISASSCAPKNLLYGHGMSFPGWACWSICQVLRLPAAEQPVSCCRAARLEVSDAFMNGHYIRGGKWVL